MPPLPQQAMAVMRRTDLLVALFGTLPAFFWLNDAPDLGLMASFLMPAGIVLASLGENARLAVNPADE